MPLLSSKPLINAPLTTGTENQNDAGNYVFSPAVVRCWVTNKTANKYNYRANTGADAATAATEASATVFDGYIRATETQEISWDGVREIRDVSIFYPTSEAPGSDNIRVMGLASG